MKINLTGVLVWGWVLLISTALFGVYGALGALFAACLSVFVSWARYQEFNKGC